MNNLLKIEWRARPPWSAYADPLEYPGFCGIVAEADKA